MLVREVMTTYIGCCIPDTNLQYVAMMMADRNVGSIPVVENADSMRPIGIITDRDIVIRVVAKGKDPSTLRAAECMSSGALTIRSDDDMRECVRMMEKHQVRRIMVVDGEGRLCGIVSQADIAFDLPEDTTGQLVRDISGPPHGATLYH